METDPYISVWVWVKRNDKQRRLSALIRPASHSSGSDDDQPTKPFRQLCAAIDFFINSAKCWQTDVEGNPYIL